MVQIVVDTPPTRTRTKKGFGDSPDSGSYGASGRHQGKKRLFHQLNVNIGNLKDLKGADVILYSAPKSQYFDKGRRS